MATQTYKICDVFGTWKDVREVTISVTEIGMVENGEPKTILNKAVDLSPRALERLLKKVETGTTPPKKRSDGHEREL